MNNQLHPSVRIPYTTPKRASQIWPTFLLFALTLIFNHSSLEAHHPSGAAGGSSGPIVTISADTLPEGATVVGVTFEYQSFDQLSDRVLVEAAENGQGVHGLKTIQSTALTIAYGLNDDLTLALRMPFLKRTGIIEGAHQAGLGTPIDDLGEPTGYGDLTFMAQYRVMNAVSMGTSLAIIGGVKLPTGDTDELAEGEDHLLGVEFQSGSGSTDWLLGLALSQRLGQLSFHSNVLYYLVQEGSQNTNLGDRLQFNLAASLRVIGDAEHMDEPGEADHDHGPQLDLVLELNGERNDREEVGGVSDNHSGGTVLYLSPGIRFAQEKWFGFVSAGFPVVSQLDGIQAEPDWRLLVGVGVALP